MPCADKPAYLCIFPYIRRDELTPALAGVSSSLSPATTGSRCSSGTHRPTFQKTFDRVYVVLHGFGFLGLALQAVRRPSKISAQPKWASDRPFCLIQRPSTVFALWLDVDRYYFSLPPCVYATMCTRNFRHHQVTRPHPRSLLTDKTPLPSGSGLPPEPHAVLSRMFAIMAGCLADH